MRHVYIQRCMHSMLIAAFVGGMQVCSWAFTKNNQGYTDVSNGRPHQTTSTGAFSQHGICTSTTAGSWEEPHDTVVTAYGPLTSSTTYTISGYTRDATGNGITGSTVTLSGDASKQTVTASNGYYEFDGMVSTETYVVTPMHYRYSFSPPHRTYTSLTASQTNQDFSGVEIPPQLALDKTTIDFGEVPAEKDKVMAFTITNNGGGTLSGTISCDKTWISVDEKTFQTKDQKCINVTVARSKLTDEGEYAGTVMIESNGGTKTVRVSVTAHCVLTKPNPYNPRQWHVTFFGSGIVPNNTTIHIMTLSGEHVKTLTETQGSNEISWDGKNEDGEEVVTGLYVYTSESPREKWVGKFTVKKT